MEQPLIRDISAQWKDAKQQAQKECENRSLFNMAEKYRVCSMFKGTETLEQVLKLFSSPQGIEFCTKRSFPTIEMCRKFKGPTAENLGIYVEEDVKIQNRPLVILVGNCRAELEYSIPGERYQVVLMHGATAHIKASNWAVVFVNKDGGGEATIEISEHAKVL